MNNILCPDHIESALKDRPCLHYAGHGMCKFPARWRCVEYIRRQGLVLRNTAIQDYCRCKRRYYHSWIQGFQGIKLNMWPLLGSLAHCELALIHSDSTDTRKEEEQRIARNKIIEQIKNDTDNEWNQSVISMKSFILSYSQSSYAKIKGKIEQIRSMRYNGFEIRTTTDLTNPDGTKIMDYKLTGNPDYYTLFTCEQQAGVYLLNNPNAKSITYRIIQRPALRKAKNETETEFEARVYHDFQNRPKYYITDKTFHRIEFDLPRIEAEIGIIAEEIKERIDKPIEHFRMERGGCLWPGECEFLKCCTARVLPESLPDHYIKRDMEIELEGA